MLFELIDRNGKRSMFTTQKSCVYDQDTLNDMASNGYKFKVDGQFVAKTKVLETVAASSDTLNPELEKFIIRNSQSVVPAHNPHKENVIIKSDTVVIQSKDAKPAGFSALKQAVETQSNEAKTKRKVRPVKCVQNDKIYKNMSEAGRDLGIDPAAVSEAVKKNKPYKGYTFEIVEDVA